MFAHFENRKLVLAAALAWLAFAPGARAAIPIGGLAIAVSPQGDKLVAAGDTRTLLVLDPQSLAVKQRIWIETTVVRLAFDKSGATLAVLDSDDRVLLFDTGTWKKKTELHKRELMATAVDVNLFAALERSSQATTIFIHSLVDGAEKGKIVLPKRTKVSSFGLSADGKRLAVLVGPVDSTAEPKVSSRDIPKGLRGAEREEFVQKNDGKVSQFAVFDVASGKPLAEKTLFYTSTHSSTQTVVHGNDVIFISYTNVCAKVAQDGTVTIFRGENSYNYGIGVSADNNLIMTGGLRKFTLTKPGTLAGVKGEIPRISGWPEYFKSFDATPGGSAVYGATSAYRLVKFGADGKVLAIVPVQ